MRHLNIYSTAFFAMFCFVGISTEVFSQSVGIGSTTFTPNASSILEIQSTAKGMLIPRMTLAQRTGIASPATSLLVYQTDAPAGFYYYNGTQWLTLRTSELFLKTVNLSVVGKGVGTTKTITIIYDNTIGEQFNIGDELYFSQTRLTDYGGGDISIGLDFVPLASETGKTVRWMCTYKTHAPGSTTAGTTRTLQTADIALDPNQYIEQDATIIIPEADLTGAEAIHLKIIRDTPIAGVSPATPPALLHVTISYYANR